jgi:uncharacterized protein YjbI with pentapeptide repeats
MDERRTVGPQLPDPNETMSPGEKAALLLRYVECGREVSFIDATGLTVRKDFSGADLDSADLSGARLRGAGLKGANLRNAHLDRALLDSADLSGAELWGASLEGASLQNVILENAILGGTRLENADLRSARLAGALFSGAHLVDANLRWAIVEGADFEEAYILGTDLGGVEGLPSDRRGAHLDSATYSRSEWTPAHLSEWLKAGAILEDFENLPEDARERTLQERQGLSLHFKTRLSSIDRLVVEAVVVAFQERNPASDVRVVEFSETDDSSMVRLMASNAADLVFLAVAVYQRVWETQAPESPADDLGMGQEIVAVSSRKMLSQLSWLVSRGDVFELWELTGGRLERTQEWTVSQSKEGLLFDLIIALYHDVEDLQSFLIRLPDFGAIRPYLPGSGAPLATVVRDAMQALAVRGAIDTSFFLGLVRDRPRRSSEIAFAASCWGVSLRPLMSCPAIAGAAEPGHSPKSNEP